VTVTGLSFRLRHGDVLDNGAIVVQKRKHPGAYFMGYAVGHR
jgi:hypothetical protein